MYKWKKILLVTVSFIILFLYISPAVAQRQTETQSEYYDYSDSNGFLTTIRVSLTGFPTIENRKETYTARFTVQSLDTTSNVEIKLKRYSWEINTDEGIISGEEDLDVLLSAVGDSYEFDFNVKSISDEYSGNATFNVEFRHDVYRDGSKKLTDEKPSINANLNVFTVGESPSPADPSEGNTQTGGNLTFGGISRFLPGLIVLILIVIVMGIIVSRRKPRYEDTTIPSMSSSQIDRMNYDELLGRREVLEEGLRKIETQLSSGLLSPAAYMDAYTKYRSEWIQINNKLSAAGISEGEDEGEIIPPTTEEVACSSCGAPYSSDAPFCPSCGSEREKCMVCLLPMAPGSEIAKCPHCSGVAHKDHLQEWVKIKGFCPKCKNKLTEYDLVQ
ncbi:zinc ribbon domain-containing protein [Candidatus Borrarchaeum sp.]|uniref:zinc ribbon domain-containing protein n=1 Tax=Candidatus Borrarchaeum sp. TaxID=2846742 RepID=UPI00257B6A75|nr:zinc ribbon domain-containing protein [Candidatus Borrarchaeum sp.]